MLRSRLFGLVLFASSERLRIPGSTAEVWCGGRMESGRADRKTACSMFSCSLIAEFEDAGSRWESTKVPSVYHMKAQRRDIPRQSLQHKEPLGLDMRNPRVPSMCPLLPLTEVRNCRGFPLGSFLLWNTWRHKETRHSEDKDPRTRVWRHELQQPQGEHKVRQAFIRISFFKVVSVP